jgi:endoglucanase
MKRAIKAILSQAPSHRILVAGPYAATVTTWELRSALALLPLLETAPKGQIIFDLHQHFDIPNGRTNDCLSWGLFYLPFKTVTETLRGRGATAMLTEIGGGPNDACAKSLGEVLGFFEQNSDVWIGWTAWSNMYGDQAISPNVSSEYYVLTGVMRKFAPLGVSGM